MIPIETLLAFVQEDAPQGDCTTEAVVPEMVCRAAVRAKATGIIAGIAEARALFEHFGVQVLYAAADGSWVYAGDVILECNGDAHAILLVERTVLNLIGRMSGIATATHAAVAAVQSISPAVRIAGTRKTAPGLRVLDKKAIVLGGGDPHRLSLSDQVLIKDNHLALVPLAEAIARARARSVYKRIEVEVETVDEAVAAAQAGADIIMLDNMDAAAVKEAIAALEEQGLRQRVVIELSGGVDDRDLATLAALGADVISMGRLTHSVTNFDVSLEMQPAIKTISL